MKKRTIRILSVGIVFVTLLSSSVVLSSAATINKSRIGKDFNNKVKSINTIVSELPDTYSSKELGFCTPVKDQGDDGLCWDYATISSFESMLLKNNLFTSELNINHMDVWGTRENNGEGWNRTIKETGYTYIPLGYLTSWSGPVDRSSKVKQGVTSIVYLNKADQHLIKQTIMQTGAVVANLNINNKGFSKNKHSYYIDSNYSVTGHTVSVVGWDDNYNKTNFDGKCTPSSNGAWLCKNSWGESNNENGYLWVSYEDAYIFDNDTFSPSFGILNYDNITDNHYLYQNEKYGATYEFQYIDNDVITYINKFDFKEHGNVLDKVIFESTSIGANYTVYYVPLELTTKIPVKNTSAWEKIAEGQISYSGYIQANCKSKILPKCKGAIAVTIDTSKTSSVNGIGVSEWLYNENSEKYIFKKKCQPNDSFVLYDNKLTDVKDYYINENKDDIGGTLVIKALTINTANAIMLGDSNLDETLNVIDATCIQKYLANLINLNDTARFLSDANEDGQVNITDATFIQKKLAGLL